MTQKKWHIIRHELAAYSGPVVAHLHDGNKFRFIFPCFGLYSLDTAGNYPVEISYKRIKYLELENGEIRP